MDVDTSQLNTSVNNSQRSQYLSAFREKLMLPESNSVKNKLMDFINTVRINGKSKTLKQVKDFIAMLSREHQSIHKENVQTYENNIEAIENIITKALAEE